MIHEQYMQQGSFTVPLRSDVRFQLLEDIVEFGHIVILSQWIEPGTLSDADLLAAARYTGVVLETDWRGDSFSIGGAGMVWHLGDDQGQGPIPSAGVTFDADTFSTVVSGLLPSAITSGTVENTGLSTFSGYFEFEPPLTSLRTVMQTLGAHFRVMPDGTFDASATGAVSNNPYVVTPTVVVVREGWGSDPTYDGVPSSNLRTRRDARAYATEVLLIQERDDATGYHSLVTSDTQATVAYKDIHNNTLSRGAIIDRPPSQDVELDNLIATELGQRIVEDTQTIETSQYEFVGGDFKAGDMLAIYDPPSGFIDTTNEIWFRGSAIWPKNTRLLKASWPLADGMGVYYRAADATYTDLTRWVQWQA